MGQDMVGETKQILRSIAGAPAFTKAEVERLLGVKLAHSRSAGPQYRYFEGDIGAGPFSKVEVREPTPQQDQSWLVNLFVRDGVELPLSAFERDMIGPKAELSLEPRVPPEGLTSYKAKDATQSIYYGFHSRRETLMSVSLHRPSD